MGIVLLVLLVWFVGWLVERHKKDKARREKLVLNAYAYNVENIHGNAAFCDTKFVEERGALKSGGIVVGRMEDSGKIVYFNPYD